jgi:hypothetical protein
MRQKANKLFLIGQNSLQGNGGEVQQPLAHYCESKSIQQSKMKGNQRLTCKSADDDIDVGIASANCL